MDYDTYINGGITVTPAVAPDRIERITTKLAKVGLNVKEYLVFTEHGEEDRIEVVDGNIEVIEGDRSTRVESVDEATSRGFEEFVSVLSAVMHEIDVTKGERKYDGKFLAFGEHQSDISGLYMNSGKLVLETPKLLWGDGSIDAL